MQAWENSVHKQFADNEFEITTKEVKYLTGGVSDKKYYSNLSGWKTSTSRVEEKTETITVAIVGDNIIKVNQFLTKEQFLDAYMTYGLAGVEPNVYGKA